MLLPAFYPHGLPLFPSPTPAALPARSRSPRRPQRKPQPLPPSRPAPTASAVRPALLDHKLLRTPQNASRAPPRPQGPSNSRGHLFLPGTRAGNTGRRPGRYTGAGAPSCGEEAAARGQGGAQHPAPCRPSLSATRPREAGRVTTPLGSATGRGTRRGREETGGDRPPLLPAPALLRRLSQRGGR